MFVQKFHPITSRKISIVCYELQLLDVEDGLSIEHIFQLLPPSFYNNHHERNNTVQLRKLHWLTPPPSIELPSCVDHIQNVPFKHWHDMESNSA